MTEMKSITMAEAFKAAGWDAVMKDSDSVKKITEEDAKKIASKNTEQ